VNDGHARDNAASGLRRPAQIRPGNRAKALRSGRYSEISTTVGQV